MYPAPVIDACETFTVAVPVLVSVMLCVLLLPTATFPKFTLVALAESTPAPLPGFPADPAFVTPTQPLRLKVARIAARVKSAANIRRAEELVRLPQ